MATSAMTMRRRGEAVEVANGMTFELLLCEPQHGADGPVDGYQIACHPSRPKPFFFSSAMSERNLRSRDSIAETW